MISIRNYISGSASQTSADWLRILHLVIESIRLRVLDIDPLAAEEYRGRLMQLQEELDRDPRTERALLTAGALNAALEDFNRQVDRRWKGQSHELQTIVGMLAKALLQITEHGRQSSEGLKSIQTDIRNAASLDNIREVKSRLATSLRLIETEMASMQSRSAAIQESLSESLTQSRQPHREHASAREIDPVTGLDGPAIAEAAIQAACAAPETWFAALFHVDRIDRVNSRFGYAAGDQLLNMASQYVAQRLGAGDQLFRWRGPSLLALLKRDLPHDLVRGEMARLAPKRVEHLVNIQHRAILLPLRATWVTVALSETIGAAEAIEVIESSRRTLTSKEL